MKNKSGVTNTGFHIFRRQDKKSNKVSHESKVWSKIVIWKYRYV